MLTASLKAFKKKTKPGSGVLSQAFNTSYGSRLFARQLFYFSSPAEALPSIDPTIENKVLAITQSFLHNIKSTKGHRLTRTVTFASLGLDSIDSIDLVIELEEKLGLQLAHSDADIVSSVHEASFMFTVYSRRLKETSMEVLHNPVGDPSK